MHSAVGIFGLQPEEDVKICGFLGEAAQKGEEVYGKEKSKKGKEEGSKKDR